jgi:hypothetical protein
MWSSWALLALSVAAALFSANAFRPVRRNRWLFVPSFFASAMTVELAAVLLPLGLVVTGGLVWAGALDRWSGWVGLAVAAVNWIALAVMVERVHAFEALTTIGWRIQRADVVASE